MGETYTFLHPYLNRVIGRLNGVLTSPYNPFLFTNTNTINKITNSNIAENVSFIPHTLPYYDPQSNSKYTPH